MPASSLEKLHKVRDKKAWPTSLPIVLFFDAKKEALKNEFMADFTIKCNGVEFRVNKVQLCVDSPYFKALITGGFKESIEGFVELKDTTVLAVAMLLSIVHLGRHGSRLETVAELWPTLLSLPELSGRQLLTTRDCELVNDHICLEFKTLFEVYVLADRCLLGQIAKSLSSYLLPSVENWLIELSMPEGPREERIADLFKHIYQTLPESDFELRGKITNACLIHMEVMAEYPQVARIIESHERARWEAGHAVAAGLKRKHELVCNHERVAGEPYESWDRYVRKRLFRGYGG